MKGIIVAAGYGTRFLPVTKTIPKEMLPLITRPSIDFILQEFLDSGIKDIVIISSRRKRALEDYLDREFELETVFKAENAMVKHELVQPCKANVSFVRQSAMLGTGHALLQALPFLGDSPVVVAYPDDLHLGTPPLAKQLIDTYEKTGCSVLASIYDPPNLNRYGVLDLDPDGTHVRDIVEKPVKGEEPSREVSIGRYLYTPEFFRYLEEGWKLHTGGEYFHTFALKKLMSVGKVVYKRVEGERLDTGDPKGYLRAIVRYAVEEGYTDLIREELGKAAR